MDKLSALDKDLPFVLLLSLSLSLLASLSNIFALENPSTSRAASSRSSSTESRRKAFLPTLGTRVNRHQTRDAMSLSTIPVSQDTISHPLKQEDTQGNGSLLREDSDHEREHDESEADGDDEEHSDPDSTARHHPRRGRRIAKRDTNNEDGDMSLSSDNDDDEESASVHPNDEEYSNLPEETVCRWKDCGKVLPSLADLVMHLSDEHIGWKKTSYTCEWQGRDNHSSFSFPFFYPPTLPAQKDLLFLLHPSCCMHHPGCSRRPIAQTTRFALISHMRSHTKHKPYDCPVPGKHSRSIGRIRVSCNRRHNSLVIVLIIYHVFLFLRFLECDKSFSRSE